MSAVVAKKPLTPSVTEPLEKKLSAIEDRFKQQWGEAKGTNRRLETLWKYVEALEGLSQEFVQFVELKGIDSWDTAALDSANRLKEKLWHAQEQLRLKLSTSAGSRSWMGRCYQFLTAWISPTITLGGHKNDRLMVANLEKTQKFLSFHFQNFQHQHTLYKQLSKTVDAKMGKLDEYPVFTSLPSPVQNDFRQLYRGLNLWEENLSMQGVPKDTLIRLVQQICSPKQAVILFKDYFERIQFDLFDLSRHLKRSTALSQVDQLRDDISKPIAKQHRELHTLGATVEKYRKFLLCNDPDPYVRTRGGFSEWTIGPEPAVAGELVSQTYDIEALDRLHKQFYMGLAGKLECMHITDVQSELDAILHAMSQPLASKSEQAELAQQFVDHLSALGELFSSDQAVVPFITDYLLKATQHEGPTAQTFFETEAFRSLYRMHLGILGDREAHPPAQRLKRLKKHLSHIKAHIKSGRGEPHIEDISTQIAGIKRVLLQFKMESSKDHSRSHSDAGVMAEQGALLELLQYRYLFGEFFHWLRTEEQAGARGMLIRNQFLFVDQLLEANSR